MQKISGFQRLKKRLSSIALAISLIAQRINSAAATAVPNAQAFVATLGIGAASIVQPLFWPLALAGGVFLGYQYYNGANSAPAKPVAAAATYQSQQLQHSPDLGPWTNSNIDGALHRLTPTERNVLKGLDSVTASNPAACNKALKQAARDRIKQLNNASLCDPRKRSTKLELTQTLVELLELTTKNPDHEIRKVLHHLMCADGYVAKTSKCFQAILNKALQGCTFKPGFSSHELFIASDLPYSNECTFGAGGLFEPPCSQCAAREAEALAIPAEKLDGLIGCILSVVDAQANDDPRLVQIPSKREILQNPLCNDVFTDYIRTGYCASDPLTTQDGSLPAFNILERGKLRKEIDELIGATPAQSEALAQLHYDLIKYAKEPKAQAEILLQYAQDSTALPGMPIHEIYFTPEGPCKLPWLSTAIDELIALQDTPIGSGTDVKPDTQPAPPQTDTEPDNGKTAPPETPANETKPSPEAPFSNEYVDGDRYIEMEMDDDGNYSMKPPGNPGEPESNLKTIKPQSPLGPEGIFNRNITQKEAYARLERLAKKYARLLSFKLFEAISKKAIEGKIVDGRPGNNIGMPFENAAAEIVDINGGEIIEFTPTKKDFRGQKLAELDFHIKTTSETRYAIECKSWDWTKLDSVKINRALKKFQDAADLAEELCKCPLLVVTPEEFNIAFAASSPLWSMIRANLAECQNRGIRFLSLQQLGTLVREN